jgi:hypothetical protein
MNTLNVISTIVVLFATVINLYIAYRGYWISHKTESAKRPVVDIKLEGLPPYVDDNQKTILKLKNVGTKETNADLFVIVSCSWMPAISYKMNFPSEGHTLDINEEIIWRFRLDEHYTPNSVVAVQVTDSKTSMFWELHEQI